MSVIHFFISRLLSRLTMDYLVPYKPAGLRFLRYKTPPILLVGSHRKKTPSRAKLRPRRRRKFLVHQRLPRRWVRSYAYPGSIPSAPLEGLSIADGAGGIKKKEIEREVSGAGSFARPRDRRCAVAAPRSNLTLPMSDPLFVRFFLSGERLSSQDSACIRSET